MTGLRFIAALSTALTLTSLAQAQSNPETFEYKKAVRKVVITNGTGSTIVTGTKDKTAKLVLTKVKFSEICEINQAQKQSTVYVSVRNRGFTGQGDCEVNISVSAPAKSDVEVRTGSGLLEINGITGLVDFINGSGDVKIDSSGKKVQGSTGSGNIELSTAVTKGNLSLDSGSGTVAVRIPKTAKPFIEFKSGSGQLTTEFQSHPKSKLKIVVRTGSGHLSIRAL